MAELGFPPVMEGSGGARISKVGMQSFFLDKELVYERGRCTNGGEAAACVYMMD